MMTKLASAMVVWWVCVAGAGAVDIAPVKRWTVRTEEPEDHNLLIKRQETIILQPQFLNYGAALDLTEATNACLDYKTEAMTNWYHLAGAVYDATNGQARFRWTSAASGTNSGYRYTVFIESPSSVVCRAEGWITVTGTVRDDGRATTPPVRTSIDWATTEESNLTASDLYIWVLAQGYITDATAGDITAIVPGFGIAGSIVNSGSATVAVDQVVFDGLYSPTGHSHVVSEITGLGSAATNPASAFATAAQGAKADASVTNSTAVAGGTGGITVVPSTNGTTVTWTISDDDAGGSSDGGATNATSNASAVTQIVYNAATRTLTLRGPAVATAAQGALAETALQSITNSAPRAASRNVGGAGVIIDFGAGRIQQLVQTNSVPSTAWTAANTNLDYGCILHIKGNGAAWTWTSNVCEWVNGTAQSLSNGQWTVLPVYWTRGKATIGKLGYRR